MASNEKYISVNNHFLASDTPRYFIHTLRYLIKKERKKAGDKVKFNSGKLRSNSKMSETETEALIPKL